MGMKSQVLLWLIPALALLFFVAQLGSVGFARVRAGMPQFSGCSGMRPGNVPGRRYDKKAPGRAEAELSGWNWGGSVGL